MGLLGDSWSDPRTMGTLQLAAGLLSPGSLGQGISRGLLGYQQSMKAAQDMEVAQTEQALRKAQVDQAMQKTKAELDAAARKQQFLGALGPQFAGVTPQQALAAPGQMAPTPANPMQWPPQPAAAKPGQLGPTLERAELIGQRAPVDWQQMMAAGMAAGFTPEQIKALAEAPNLGRQKVARVEETTDSQGRPVKRQFSEFGDVMGNDMRVYKEGKIVNFGDFHYLVDPVTGKSTLLGKNGMTPGEAASNGLAWTKLKQEQSQAGGYDLKESPTGFVYVPKVPGRPAIPVVGTDGKQVPGASSGNLTEGERKASGLYSRLTLAISQMDTANPTGKANPGALNNVIPSFMKDADRQRVEAAQLDFLDAGLALTTGAAYTKEQLYGMRDSYFPRYGDDSKTLEDKTVRRNNLKAAARLAAGRGGLGSGSTPPKTAGSGDWSGYKD